MSYETIKMGNFVFFQGDESNQKFYVLLSGQVGVITRKNFTSTQQALNRISAPSMLLKSENNLDEIPEKGTENPKTEGAILKEPPKRRSTLRFGENFGVTVARTMAAKKAAAMAMKILKSKSNAMSLASLEEDENNDQEFKELAEQYGALVRILNPGDDFGDAGMQTLIPEKN